MNSNLEIIVEEILEEQKAIAKENYKKVWSKIKDEYREIWDEENKKLLDIYGHDLIIIPTSTTLFEGKKVMQIKVENVKEDDKKIELLLPRDIKKNGKDYTALYGIARKYIGTINTKSVETKECTLSRAINSDLWRKSVTKSVREIQEVFWSNLAFSKDPEIARLEQQRALEVLQNITIIEFDDDTNTFIVTTREGKEIKISEDDKDYGFMFLPLLYVDAKRDGKLNSNVTLDDVDVVLKHPKEVVSKNKKVKNNGGTPIQTKPKDTKDLNSEGVATKADIVKEAFENLDPIQQQEILDYNEKHKKKIDQSFLGHLASKAAKPFKNGYDRLIHCKLADWGYYVFLSKPREIIEKLNFDNFKEGTLADITGKEEDKNYRLKLPNSMIADIHNKMNNQNDDAKETNENEQEKENSNVEPVEDNSKNNLGENNNYGNPSNEEESIHENENNEVTNPEPISKPIEPTKPIEPIKPLDPVEAKFQEICQEMQRKLAEGIATSEDFQKMTEASLAHDRYKQQKIEEEERLRQEEEKARIELQSRRAKEAPEIMVKNQMIRFIRQEIEGKNYSTARAAQELERRLQENGITKAEYDAGRAFYKDELEQIERAKKEQQELEQQKNQEILKQKELREQRKRDALREMIERQKSGDFIGALVYINFEKRKLGITDEEIEQAQKIYQQEMETANMIQNAPMQQAEQIMNMNPDILEMQNEEEMHSEKSR